MGNWLVERRLSQVASRLKSLRSELAVIDEQMIHLGDDADDQAIRALVSEPPALPTRHAMRSVTSIAWASIGRRWSRRSRLSSSARTNSSTVC